MRNPPPDLPYARREDDKILNKRQKGAEGENIAADYLCNKGYRILGRNYRFEHGEIDIIAEDGITLVFVEVRGRGSKDYGEAEDSVTPKKRRKIRATAEGYMFEKKIADRECRFDVIAVDYHAGKIEIRHTENAF